jgi:GAF domain-containing protein
VDALNVSEVVLDAGRAHEIIQRMNSRQELARNLAELIRRARNYTWVGVYDVADSEVAALAWTGARPPAHPRFPIGSGITGRAIRTRSTVVVNDVAADADYLTTFSRTQSEMIVPVVGAAEVVGTVDVASDRAGAFTESDRRFVEECVRLAREIWA